MMTSRLVNVVKHLLGPELLREDKQTLQLPTEVEFSFGVNSSDGGGAEHTVL